MVSFCENNETEVVSKKMPDNYWGVGYENGRYTPKSDSTTAYHKNWFQLKFKLIFRVWKDLFLGINYDYNQTHATDVNAYKGFFIELAGTGYAKHSQGNHVFQAYELDYRQYQTIKREGSTLAWQIKTRNVTGDVPWTELSMIGTPYDLRGYTWGQYRDNTMLFVLAEYRHMFKRKKENFRGGTTGPFGFVVWLGEGSVAPNYNELNNWLPNGGFGLRFEIQERMNIRIDYGIGVESSAFYISFNEAF